MNCFFTFLFFLQYAGDPGIRYPKINPEAGYVDDTYIGRSEDADPS